MGFRVRGLDAVKAQLRALGEELATKAAKGAARAAFKPVLDAAKALAPRDTGALADSLVLASAVTPTGGAAVGIRIGKGRGAAQARVAAAAFGEAQIEKLPPARRWHFTEFGTSRQPAHPFLRPAFDASVQTVVDSIAAELKKAIARAIKKGGL